MHNLRQVGLVTDEQRPPLRATCRRQRQRLGVSRPAPSGGCTTGSTPSDSHASSAVSRALTFGLVNTSRKPMLEHCQGPSRVARLRLAALGQPPFGIRSCVVRFGLAVAKEPELGCHAPASTRGRTRESASPCEPSRRAPSTAVASAARCGTTRAA